MAISHVKSNTIADFTGSVTVFDSQGSTVTAAASNLVRPTDWNSAHNQFLTIGGNTAGASTASGSNIVMQGGNNITLSLNAQTLIFSGPNLAGYLTTAAQSNHSHGNPTLALTNLSGTTASASNGLTLSLSAAAPGGGGVGLSAGTQSVGTGTIVFANSNGLSFGMSGSSQITASHNGLTSQTVQTQSNVQGLSAGTQVGRTGDIVFSDSNGISFGMSGSSRVTASYTVPSVAGLLSAINISAGSTSGNLSALTLGNANGLTFGLNAGTVTASHNALTTARASTDAIGLNTAQTNVTWTVNSSGLSFNAAGYAGTTTAVTGNALLTLNSLGLRMDGVGLAGTSTGFAGANISGSLTHNSAGLNLSLSVAAPGGGGAGISAGTQSVNTGTVVFSDSNGISFGMSGSSRVTASYTVPSVAGLISAVNISAGTTSNNLAAMTFSNLNGVTFGLNGSVVTASVAAVGGAQTGLSGLANSETTYTSGSVTFSALGAITIRSTTGQQFQFSVNSQTAQTANVVVPSAGTQTATSGTIVFADSNGLSFGMSGSSQITASHNGLTSQSVQTQSIVQGISAGTQVGRTGDIVFSNSNGISFGMSGSSRVTASYTVPSVAGLLSAINISAGTTSNNLSALTFNNLNGITFGLNASTITASHNGLTTARASNDAIGLNTAQTNVTWTVNSSGLSFNAAGYAGTTTAITGNALLTLNSLGLRMDGVGLAGTSTGFTGANISGSMTHNSAGLAVSLSVAAPGGGGMGISAGTQSVNTGTMIFADSNGISFGMSGSSRITASYTVPSQTVTISATSNTTGSSSGTAALSGLIFKGQGAASVGISNGSIIIDAPNAAAGNVTFSAGANSAGLASIVFSNSNGVSFGLNGSTITASAVGGGGAESNNVNLLGANTAGNTTASGSTLGFSGINLTLSGTNNSQIIFSAPAVSSLVGASGIGISTAGSTISIYQPVALSRFSVAPEGASSAGSAMAQGSMSFQRFFVPDNLSFSRVDLPVLMSLASSATTNTGGLLISSGAVIYSVSGTSTLNPIVGVFGTTTYTYASNTANFNSLSGPRYLSFPLATFLTPGEYYIGFQLSTNNNSSIGLSTTALGATISVPHGPIYTASQWQEFGAVTATSLNMRPMVGVAASVTATGQTQQMSNITQTGTALMRANVPAIFRNF